MNVEKETIFIRKDDENRAKIIIKLDVSENVVKLSYVATMQKRKGLIRKKWKMNREAKVYKQWDYVYLDMQSSINQKLEKVENELINCIIGYLSENKIIKPIKVNDDYLKIFNLSIKKLQENIKERK